MKDARILAFGFASGLYYYNKQLVELLFSMSYKHIGMTALSF